MSKDRMTKTEAKRTVAELRSYGAEISRLLTPTPKWIVRELRKKYGSDWTPLSNLPAGHPQRREVIEDALNNIDGLSAMLREALERGDI